MRSYREIATMIPAERLKLTDLPVALMLSAAGILFLALRKQQAEARHLRVQRGEMTEAEAKKKDRLHHWCAWGMTLIGLLLVLVWATGH